MLIDIQFYFIDKSSPVCDKKKVGPVVIAEGGKVHKDTGGSLFFPQTGQDKVSLGPVPGVRLQALQYRHTDIVKTEHRNGCESYKMILKP